MALTDERRSRRNSKRRILTSTYIGTVIEWFDFYLYGTAAAIVFNVLFFPQVDSLIGTLAASLGYQVAGAIGGGFGPLIAGSLLAAAGGAPNYVPVAVFMLVVCLLSAGAAWFAPDMNQRALREV